jgi:hypothetical protein
MLSASDAKNMAIAMTLSSLPVLVLLGAAFWYNGWLRSSVFGGCNLTWFGKSMSSWQGLALFVLTVIVGTAAVEFLLGFISGIIGIALH